MPLHSLYVKRFNIEDYVQKISYTINFNHYYSGTRNEPKENYYVEALINWCFDPFIKKLIELSHVDFQDNSDYKSLLNDFGLNKLYFVDCRTTLYSNSSESQSWVEMSNNYHNKYGGKADALMSLILPIIKEYLIKTYTTYGHLSLLEEVFDIHDYLFWKEYFNKTNS